MGLIKKSWAGFRRSPYWAQVCWWLVVGGIGFGVLGDLLSR